MVQAETVVAGGVKITCQRDELAAKLAIVSRAVSTRVSVQVLAGVLLRAEEGRVELAATDMELSIRTAVTAEVSAAGSVVVPGRLLVELVRLLPENDVVIEYGQTDGLAQITCGPAQYRLNTYSADDFPTLPDAAAAELFEPDRELLLESIARVGRAASRDESRPVLTGILVRFEDGKLVMAATDSYRLAVKETAIEGGAPQVEAIIPARALAEVTRIAQSADRVDLGLQDNQVVFVIGDVVLTTRRIDGQFPNYKQLLPESFEHELVLPRLELLDVVRRISVMAQRNSPLRLRFAEGELTVSAQTQDVGEARESLPVGFSGESLEIGFNAEFLREGIESVEAEEIELKLISPLRPGLLHSEADDFWYLIMPIRLAG